MFAEIAPGVFTVEHRVAEGKNGVVVGARAALAIDSGNDRGEGRAMADCIRARGRRPDRLALTHGHGDHILGSGAFAEAEVFAHALTPGIMRGELARLAARAGRPVAALAGEVRWPTVTFDGELRIDLGGRVVRIFPTLGHSGDGVALYLEEERVLFAGDTVVTGIVPAIAQGDSARMVASLRLLLDLPIETLVAGHGPVLRGRAAVREWLTWQAGYLTGVRDFVRWGLARGREPAAIAAEADYGRFVGERLPAERHNMVQRHRNTVLKIIEEETRRDECAR